uniref:beta-lactoglobulin-2-like isoform X1 n=2 Tax=Callithrix jacchus TaxID=9483 RepID=UPI0023DCFEB0|nr:beta-lactoglobulin-2-like isoform X1 [Callithrix jacchus]XP_054093862.1 beta-lactoglobulin-2-like isoform X2 [Callithrix jacchus]XP_054093863.1 beta-lactoglobulin-2-like isoform X2 [Callithrix jacchus]
MATACGEACASPRAEEPQCPGTVGRDVAHHAMAASDSTLLEARDAPLRNYITSLTPTADGNLEITLQRWENNNCVEKKVLAEKTENSRNFKINFMAVNEVTLLQTDYDKFLFLCMKSTAAPNQSTMCQYLARSEEADNEVMNEFFRVVLTVPVDSRMLMGWHRLPEPCPV